MLQNVLRAVLAATLLCNSIGLAKAANSPAADLQRAQQRIPRDAWKGKDFSSMNARLTQRLRESGHSIRDCAEWSSTELQQLQKQIFMESEKELLAIYHDVADRRRQRFESLEALEAHWKNVDAAASSAGTLGTVRRDGLCHETVMWFVHHLQTTVQKRLATRGLALPSLPQTRHREDTIGEAQSAEMLSARGAVFQEYEHQVSCQQCHTGTMSGPWKNATLPQPLPVDKKHPGQERQRSCDYQNQPPCGACEGLGGRRWGDDPEQMTPMKCEVIHGAKQTTLGHYPSLATAHLTGETRSPIEVIPTVPGNYTSITGKLYLGWQGNFMGLRYDFDGLGTEVSAQTREQAKDMDVGPTIHIGGGQCACTPSIAGVMHVHAFDPLDPLDPLKLPSKEGGVKFLGRVRVIMDGDSPSTNGTVAIADHYMKWAFHFLVDADPKSPSFGLPLRLYGATGVRQVFDNWKLGDPAADRPDLWKLPQGCKVMSPSCAIFKNATGVSENVVV